MMPVGVNVFQSRRISGLRLLRAALIAIIAAALASYGAASPLQQTLLALAVAIMCLVSCLACPEPATSKELSHLAIGLLVALSSWVLVQSFSFRGNPFQHEVWSAASSAMYGIDFAGAISIDPAGSRAALIALSIPFLTFVAALRLFSTDTHAVLFLKLTSTVGAAIAGISLLQYIIAPDMLLLSEKQHYLDSFTATFVNRNTAATFLGLTALVAATFAWRGARDAGWLSSQPSAPSSAPVFGLPQQREALLFVLLTLTAVVALALTKSRAGVMSTVAAFFVLGVFASFDAWRAARSAATSNPNYWRTGAVIICVFVILAAAGGQALFRAEVAGLNDQRFCMAPEVLSALRANWLFGAGFGTFYEAFSAFRPASCQIYGAFDRAHNIYLEGWLGLGLAMPVACVVAIAALSVTFVIGLRKRRRLRYAGALGFAVLLQLLLHSLLDFSLQISGVAVLAAGILATCCTLCRGRSAT